MEKNLKEVELHSGDPAPFDGALLNEPALRYYIDTKDKYDELFDAVALDPSMLYRDRDKSLSIVYITIAVGVTMMALRIPEGDKVFPYIGAGLVGFGLGCFYIQF